MERKGKANGREEEGELRKVKKEETEKEAEGDDDQRLESGREGEGERGKIMASTDESSFISISLMFLRRDSN